MVYFSNILLNIKDDQNDSYKELLNRNFTNIFSYGITPDGRMDNYTHLLVTSGIYEEGQNGQKQILECKDKKE